MDKKQEHEMLIAVFNSLNNIEVKGQANVCNMAGCIQILMEVIENRNNENQNKLNES